MILLTLSVAVPPGRRKDILEAFGQLHGPLRGEPGCLGCGLYQELGDADVFLYVEEWETPEQLQRHLRSGRCESLLALMEASARPPMLRYHLVSCTRGLEYLEAVRLGPGACPPRAPDQVRKEGP
jgi:quinol monooxygenase YgiN